MFHTSITCLAFEPGFFSVFWDFYFALYLDGFFM